MKNESTLDLVVRLAELMWPEFVEVAGYVFAKGIASRDVFGRRGLPSSRWTGLDRTGVEAFESHLHIIDALGGGRSRPDRTAAIAIGRAMARTWLARLQHDFPLQRFRVYFTSDDEPIVRFHRVYPDEPVWLDEADWPRRRRDRQALVLDTHPPRIEHDAAMRSEARRATRLLKGRTIARVRRQRVAEVLLEFQDGWRLYVDGQRQVELSILEGPTQARGPKPEARGRPTARVP
jgi:hypothetical protein